MSRKHSYVLSSSFAALLLFSLSACDAGVSEQSSEPEAPNHVTGYVSYEVGYAGKGGGNRHDNANKYKDSSKPNAQASKGNTSLTARALLGGDGTTTLELTTAAFETESLAPGQITKVQVKSLAPDVKNGVRWTENYKSRSAAGTAIYNYSDLERGSTVAVQANIEGIDNGTTILRVEETVKLRPNLRANGLQAHDGMVTQPITVNVAVGEGNGDVGAWSDCILYADGTEIDRVYRMWTDANGTVGCEFTAHFDTPGIKTLRAKAGVVQPGDFDMGDNMSEEISITIHEPASNKFRWNASARIDLEPFVYENGYNHQEWSQTGTRQSFNASGTANRTGLNFPMDVDLSVASGANTWHEATINQATPSYGYYAGRGRRSYQCFQDASSGSDGFFSLELCTWERRGNMHATFRYSRAAQQVVYNSTYLGGGYSHYETNDAVLPHNGSSISFRMKVASEGESSVTLGEVPLIETSHAYEYNYSANYYRRYHSRYLHGNANGVRDR